MRLIDADALKQYVDDCLGCTNCPDKRYRCDDNCEVYLSKRWSRVIDAQPTVDAVPVEFIKTEIDRLIDDINDAVEDGTTEWAEIIMIRKATLELVLVKWRAEREEE